MDAAQTTQTPGRLEAAGAWVRGGWGMARGLSAALALSRRAPQRAWETQRQSCRQFLQAMGIQLSVDDRSGLKPEDGRPVLFVHLDQQTLLSVALYPLIMNRPFSLIVNIEFALLPLVGWQTVANGAVVVVRQWSAQAQAGMRRAAQRLSEGQTMAMSVEGQRSKDGSLSAYKKGAAVLAIESQCDIVPFMTHGEWDRWPRGQWRIRPGVVDAVLYPAISTRGLSYRDRDDLLQQLRQLAVRERRLHGRVFAES